MPACDFCINRASINMCTACQDERAEAMQAEAFESGLVWGVAVVAMFEAIKSAEFRRAAREAELIRGYRGELYNAKFGCVHEIVHAPGGGVKCRKCPAWFCW